MPFTQRKCSGSEVGALEQGLSHRGIFYLVSPWLHREAEEHLGRERWP